MTTLIDTKHIGDALRSAQKRANMGTAEIAGILHIKKSLWRAYCRGEKPVPKNVLIWMFDAGLSSILFNHRESSILRQIRQNRNNV